MVRTLPGVNGVLQLQLTEAEAGDLAEYLKSL